MTRRCLLKRACKALPKMVSAFTLLVCPHFYPLAASTVLSPKTAGKEKLTFVTYLLCVSWRDKWIHTCPAGQDCTQWSHLTTGNIFHEDCYRMDLVSTWLIDSAPFIIQYRVPDERCQPHLEIYYVVFKETLSIQEGKQHKREVDGSQRWLWGFLSAPSETF